MKIIFITIILKDYDIEIWSKIHKGNSVIMHELQRGRTISFQTYGTNTTTTREWISCIIDSIAIGIGNIKSITIEESI